MHNEIDNNNNRGIHSTKAKLPGKSSVIENRINIKRKNILNKELAAQSKSLATEDQFKPLFQSSQEKRPDSLYDSTDRGNFDFAGNDYDINSTSAIQPSQSKLNASKYNSIHLNSSDRKQDARSKKKDYSRYFSQKEHKKIERLLKQMDESEIRLINSQNEVFNNIRNLSQSDINGDIPSLKSFLKEPLDFLTNIQN